MATMKAIIAIVALALLVAACAKAPEAKAPETAKEVVVPAVPEESTAVSAIGSDVSGVQDLNKDVDGSGLDSFDNDVSTVESMPLG